MRFRRLTFLLVFALLTVSPAFPRGKKAAETLPEDVAIIRSGMALHDAGKYEEAIAEYAKVLARNPDDVLAIYETAFAHFARKDWEQCLTWTERGLRYEGRPQTLLNLFVIHGSCLDEHGQPGKAIKSYKKGIAAFPDSALLHFNTGVTYQRMGNLKESRKSLQQALRMDPLHASSHLRLGQVYLQSNQRVPGILALTRFLVLEPASPRSPTAVQMLLNAIQYGVESKGDGNVNVTLFMPEKKSSEEGDFQSAEMMLSLHVAGFHASEIREKPPHDKLELAFGGLFEQIVPEDGQTKGFAQTFYGPYFSELHKKEMTPVLLRFAFRNLTGANDGEWIQANREKMREFLAWSEGYSWKQRQ